MSADHVEQFVSQNVSTLTDNLNQTKSFYYLADMPLPNIAYVLFGLVCLITVIGLFGNSLTLAIMIKLQDKPLKGNDILISALAVFDGMALIPTAISNPIVYDVIGRDIRAVSTIGCKVFNCIWSSALVSSYTVVILICIERFVAVWCPLRARYILSRKFVIKCLLISVITVPMMYVSAVVLYSEIEDKICITNFAGTVYSSVLKRTPNTTVLNAAIGFNLALYLAILYILTPMILVKLYKQRVTRRRLTANAQDKAQYRTTVKLMAVIVVFMLIALPFAFGIILRTSGIVWQVTNTTAFSLGTLSMLLNYATNFLLYNIFDAEFRSKALSLFNFGTKARPVLTMNIPDKHYENRPM